MATWRYADGRPAGQPSALAATTVRALTTSIIVSMLAREGKQRWCEVAAVNTPAAEAFLKLYPGTRFLCLYRACPGFIRTALDASPWGIADPAFAPFIRAYPASTAAAMTACWTMHTTNLLAFEQAHPQACLRVRFEDLTGTKLETAENMKVFLGLTGADDSAKADGNQPRPTAEGSGPATEFLADLIPPGILEQANELLRQLSYTALHPSPAG